MFYDLHIHSCLSPCANDDMTPNNIVQMAKIKGLDLIAVCDHNCVKQQPVMAYCYNKYNIKGLYGVEVQTQEDVHILGLFINLDDCMRFGEWLEAHKPFIKNDIAYFGNQQVCNEDDTIAQEVEGLLLVSIKVSIDQIIQKIHEENGRVILAHVLDKANSITHELGFIPEGLAFDGIEIKKKSQKDIVQLMHPWLKDTLWFIDSDAHQLNDISEKVNEIDYDLLDYWWGRAL